MAQSILIPIPTSAKINADLAAVGFVSFHTKNMTIPRIGIQHKESIFTAMLDLSSTEVSGSFTLPPHFRQISESSDIRSLQCGQYITHTTPICKFIIDG